MGGDAMYRILLAGTRAKGVAFKVLMALGSWADQEGFCYPSLDQLAKKARISRKNVPRALKTLVKLAEVEVHTRGHSQRGPVKERFARAGGWQPTNLYRILCLAQPKVARSKLSSTRGHLVDQRVSSGGYAKVSSSPAPSLLYYKLDKQVSHSNAVNDEGPQGSAEEFVPLLVKLVAEDLSAHSDATDDYLIGRLERSAANRCLPFTRHTLTRALCEARRLLRESA